MIGEYLLRIFLINNWFIIVLNLFRILFIDSDVVFWYFDVFIEINSFLVKLNLLWFLGWFMVIFFIFSYIFLFYIKDVYIFIYVILNF